MILTPKNWNEFQHYKDRSPPWIKLHRSILDNYDFHCLPDASKALAPLLWLLASEHEDGHIDATPDALAFRLRTSTAKFLDALKPLIDSGFFESDSTPLASCLQPACLETEAQEKVETQEKLEKRADARDGYPFNGTVVRLSPKNFSQWVEVYPFLDLKAELTARDAWLSGPDATDRDRKNWFVSTAKYLANRNAEAKARGRSPGSVDDVHPVEIYGNLQ